MSLNTSNPAFSDYFFDTDGPGRMTVSGIIIKTIFCLGIVTACAGYMWHLYDEGVKMKWIIIAAMLVALIVSVMISFFQKWVMPLTLIYSVAKGVFLGAASAWFKDNMTELIWQAVAITIVTFFILLFLYQTRIIVVTKLLRSVIVTAAMSIFFIYFITWILGFFDIIVPFVVGTSWWAIGFNVIAAIVAALTFLLDFDYIERYKGIAPKIKEWNATWGLLVSIIWMYWEVLR